MGRPRKNDKVPATFDELYRDAGEGMSPNGINNAGRELTKYQEIKRAGGIPEIYFSRRDGYSVVDGLQRDIQINRMRHQDTFGR